MFGYVKSYGQYPVWGGLVSIDMDTQTIKYRTALSDTVLVSLSLSYTKNKYHVERSIDKQGRVVIDEFKGKDFIQRTYNDQDTQNLNQFFASPEIISTLISETPQKLALENPSSFVPFRFEITTKYNKKEIPKYIVQIRYKHTNSKGEELFENYQVTFNEKFRPTAGQVFRDFSG